VPTSRGKSVENKKEEDIEKIIELLKPLFRVDVSASRIYILSFIKIQKFTFQRTDSMVEWVFPT